MDDNVNKQCKKLEDEYKAKLLKLNKQKGMLDNLVREPKVRIYMNLKGSYDKTMAEVNTLRKEKEQVLGNKIMEDIANTNDIFIYMGTYKKSEWNYRGLLIGDKFYEMTNHDDMEATYRVYLSLNAYKNRDEVIIPVSYSNDFESKNKVIVPLITDPSIEMYYNKYDELKASFEKDNNRLTLKNE